MREISCSWIMETSECFYDNKERVWCSTNSPLFYDFNCSLGYIIYRNLRNFPSRVCQVSLVVKILQSDNKYLRIFMKKKKKEKEYYLEIWRNKAVNITRFRFHQLYWFRPIFVPSLFLCDCVWCISLPLLEELIDRPWWPYQYWPIKFWPVDCYLLVSYVDYRGGV